jgi:preprotein translocase subunit SecG
MHMAKWREEPGKSIKDGESAPSPDEESPTATTTAPQTTARERRGAGHRVRTGTGLRSGVGRVSGAAATLVRVLAMIICVLLALHIAFVVFSANQDNAIVRTVNDWADWFAWRFRDIFVPKDERVGVLVNYGIAAVVYLIAGRVVAGLIRRVR